MTRNRIAVAVMLSALWAVPWAAWAEGLPYPALAWEEFPSREWSLDKLDPAEFYPDWNPSASKLISYFEAEQYFGLGYGLATCQAYDELLIAAAYYSTDGYVYITHQPLPLAPGQRVTLSWQLPEMDEGVSRLMLLSNELQQAEWEKLLVSPVRRDLPQPGLVAEQWLGRQRKQYPQLPWYQVLRTTPSPPEGFEYYSWPQFRAWLQTDLSLATKDCWVETDAFTQYNVDEFGSSGRWALDWSNRFILNCQLPEDYIFDAVLVVTGKPMADFTGSSQLELELDVNGWSIGALTEEATVNGMQQYMAQVGRYLQQGENQLAVRIDAVSGGILQLESIELWVR